MQVEVTDGTVAVLVCVAAKVIGWEKAREMLCPQLAGLKGSEIFSPHVVFTWDDNGDCTRAYFTPPPEWFSAWATEKEIETYYTTGAW